jgi:predicted RNase H-like HicB family nuclease
VVSVIQSPLPDGSVYSWLKHAYTPRVMVRRLMALKYPVILKPENGMVAASIPDVPGVQTFGDDEQEAFDQVMEALESMFTVLTEGKESIPLPRAPRPGEKLVTLPASFAAKLGRYRATFKSCR